jgi:Rrf2 family protein
MHQLHLPRKSLLALVAVIDIAINGDDQPVRAYAMAHRYDLPPRHLEPVLQSLVRHGILRGIRGPRGGYEFAVDERRLTVRDIVRAVSADPANGFSPAASIVLDEVVMPVLGDAVSAFSGALARVNLDELVQSAQRRRRSQRESAHAFAGKRA